MEKTEAYNAEEELDDELGLSPEEIDAIQAIETKEQLFEYIDKKLTDEEKEEIRKSDPIDLHFGFGTWIRNTFIYSDLLDIDAVLGDEEDDNLLVDPEIGKKFHFRISIHPDDISGTIIELYQQHLRETKIEE